MGKVVTNAPFRDLVLAEIRNARERHKPYNSEHEAYAVLLEEVDELWDDVKKQSAARIRYRTLTELAQIAAVCELWAIELGYTEG